LGEGMSVPLSVNWTRAWADQVVLNWYSRPGPVATQTEFVRPTAEVSQVRLQ
jgi:hypothetical protein